MGDLPRTTMDADEQIKHFANELDNLVDRYRVEYDLSYAAVVGALAMKQHLLCNEAEEKHNEE